MHQSRTFWSRFRVHRDEAERQKTEIKTIVEKQRNNLEAKKNVIKGRATLLQQSKNAKKTSKGLQIN